MNWTGTVHEFRKSPHPKPMRTRGDDDTRPAGHNVADLIEKYAPYARGELVAMKDSGRRGKRKSA